MNVSREKVVQILEEQQEHLPENNWDWNIYLNYPEQPWSAKMIEQLIKQLNSYKDLTLELEKDLLYVKVVDGSMTLLVEGLANISDYCQNEYFEVVPHTWKEIVTLQEKTIEKHYSLDIQSTIQRELDFTIDETTIDWLNIAKYYQQVKRYIYQHKTGRYIIEFSKSNPDAFGTMRDADLSSQPQEVKVYIQLSETDSVKKEERLSHLIRHMLFLMKNVTHEDYLMTLEEQKKVIAKYLNLISSVRDLNKYEKQNPQPFFLAPKPITLEKKNLIDPETAYGVVSILKNYTVTDKADGERMLLYVDDVGEVYLINNTFNVRKTGISVTASTLHQSLLDGEYIPKYLLAEGHNETDIFAVFDAYYINNESIMHLPLIQDGKPDRYMKMKLALQSDYWNTKESNLRIELKEHFAKEGKELFQKCKDILENKKRRYDIDGLVFTPMDLPVFAYYPNQFKKLKGKSVAWDRVFKWKPAEQNTIDFLVKQQEEDYIDTVSNKRYRRFKLFTGYNASQWEEIPVWKGVQYTFQKEKMASKDEEYQAKLFKPIENYHPAVSVAFLPVNSAGQCITEEDHTIVTDNTIVEFAYDKNDKIHPSMRWKANRVREDKTRAYRMTGSMSKTANDLKVALNIWQNIHNPVAYEHIIGQLPVSIDQIPTDIEERLLGTNDVYYARDIPRNHMLSVHMLNFHNYGIKSYLYSRPEKRDSLLELACGMAGDLPRWRDHRYNFILGVDLVKNNIESPQGSYGRYLYQRKEFLKNHRQVQRLYYPQAIFVVGDCALPLETGEAAKGKDYDSEALLKLLYLGKVTEKFNYLNAHRIPGKASRKFDVVSCQFAIHYFCKSKDRLEGFLRNVSFNLKPNGKFITTFMDGVKVHQLIQKEGFAKGVKDDNVVWCIQKQYKSFNKANAYGRLIDVYLENTNQFILEYLVHFDVLKEKAKEYHLEVVEDGFFGDMFQMLKQKMVENDPNRNRFIDNDLKALDKDPVQTQFSFLNRWVIFRKMEEREIVA